MSYRFRFAAAKKDYINKVRNMEYNELVETTKKHYPKGYSSCPGESDYFAIYEMFGQEEIFDMGDCPYAKDIIKVSETFFTNLETAAHFSEENIYFCTKKSFLAAIEGMRKLNQNYYQELINTPDLIPLFLEEKKREWSLFSDVMDIEISEEKKEEMNSLYLPYSLNENIPDIVTSWRYEYAIFEMVRIYKSFDWENNALLFYGW
jgi:hypothetical protein